LEREGEKREKEKYVAWEKGAEDAMAVAHFLFE